MTSKRLVPILVFAFLTAAVVVSNGLAGDVADQPCPDAAGPDTALCPAGRVGAPYSLTFQLKEGAGCGPVSPPVWSVNSGSFPPGLTLSSEGVVSGTPTQAGNFSFYVRVHHPFVEGACAGDFSDKQVTIPINPGAGAPVLPKLIIGPELVSPGTVGTPYMAAMTANLSDAKTWSIASGTLPPGLTLGSTDGVISGMPATSGAYSFTVQAVIADGRGDAKSLTLDIRDRLALTRSGDFETRVVRTEVGVEIVGGLSATGGFGAYLWSVEGDLPPGLVLGDDGTITGSAEKPGSYRFTVAVTDSESRRATYVARMVVVKRLAIKTKLLKPARVGLFMSRKVATTGGVAPLKTKVTRGPLPPGVFFDRRAGVFAGSPRKAGTWTIRVEIVDSLGVKTTGIVVLVVRK